MIDLINNLREVYKLDTNKSVSNNFIGGEVHTNDEVDTNSSLSLNHDLFYETNFSLIKVDPNSQTEEDMNINIDYTLEDIDLQASLKNDINSKVYSKVKLINKDIEKFKVNYHVYGDKIKADDFNTMVNCVKELNNINESQNQSLIDLKVKIDSNKTSIDTNATSIAGNTITIASNTAKIDTNNTIIKTNSDKIASLKEDINFKKANFLDYIDYNSSKLNPSALSATDPTNSNSILYNKFSLQIGNGYIEIPGGTVAIPPIVADSYYAVYFDSQANGLNSEKIQASSLDSLVARSANKIYLCLIKTNSNSRVENIRPILSGFFKQDETLTAGASSNDTILTSVIGSNPIRTTGANKVLNIILDDNPGDICIQEKVDFTSSVNSFIINILNPSGNIYNLKINTNDEPMQVNAEKLSFTRKGNENTCSFSSKQNILFYDVKNNGNENNNINTKEFLIKVFSDKSFEIDYKTAPIVRGGGSIMGPITNIYHNKFYFDFDETSVSKNTRKNPVKNFLTSYDMIEYASIKACGKGEFPKMIDSQDDLVLIGDSNSNEKGFIIKDENYIAAESYCGSIRGRIR